MNNLCAAHVEGSFTPSLRLPLLLSGFLMRHLLNVAVIYLNVTS